MEITRNHGHKPNLKRNRFKFLNLGPTEQSVPKLPHFPNPYFGAEIGKFRRCQSGGILHIGELAKFQIFATPGSKVTGFRIFGPKNGPVPKNHYATPLTRILLGAFVAVGDPTIF